MRKVILTTDAPAPVGPYSQAIVANGLIFLSGQIALNPESGELVGAKDISAETHQIMANIRAVLKASGSSLNSVTKVTVYLTDIAEWGKVNEVYQTYFDVDPPARTTVGVAALPRGAHIEIEMIALTDAAAKRR